MHLQSISLGIGLDLLVFVLMSSLKESRLPPWQYFHFNQTSFLSLSLAAFPGLTS